MTFECAECGDTLLEVDASYWTNASTVILRCPSCTEKVEELSEVKSTLENLYDAINELENENTELEDRVVDKTYFG